MVDVLPFQGESGLGFVGHRALPCAISDAPLGLFFVAAPVASNQYECPLMWVLSEQVTIPGTFNQLGYKAGSVGASRLSCII